MDWIGGWGPNSFSKQERKRFISGWVEIAAIYSSAKDLLICNQLSPFLLGNSNQNQNRLSRLTEAINQNQNIQDRRISVKFFQELSAPPFFILWWCNHSVSTTSLPEICPFLRQIFWDQAIKTQVINTFFCIVWEKLPVVCAIRAEWLNYLGVSGSKNATQTLSAQKTSIPNPFKAFYRR